MTFLCVFSVDDLKQISQKHIEEGILASCCLLAFLNEETMLSLWCVKEWECARDNDIPIIVVVDTDICSVRPLIKKVGEKKTTYRQ